MLVIHTSNIDHIIRIHRHKRWVHKIPLVRLKMYFHVFSDDAHTVDDDNNKKIIKVPFNLLKDT